MGFFSLLETFFFISLAITFVLIMMLVYHFKGRLVLLEEKCNTMFEIMNSMVKEMKNIRDSVNTPPSVPTFDGPAFTTSVPFGGAASGLFPPELFRMFQMNGSQPYDGEDDGEEDDEDIGYEVVDDEQEFKKIVVSDTELSDDDEDDDNVKVISVDMNDIDESEPLADLEEEDIVLDDEDSNEDMNEDTNEETNNVNSSEKVDYKKMDVSYLRTMVLTRGLATDTKKMKKSELIRLLEE